jgi:isopentenyl-diphosphate delta-isomerase
VARPLLAPAIESKTAVVDWLGEFLDELRICMHGCGTTDVPSLRRATLTKLW